MVGKTRFLEKENMNLRWLLAEERDAFREKERRLLTALQTAKSLRGSAIYIGEYTLSNGFNTAGDFWLEHESGEGTQVVKADLEQLIHRFYKEIF